MQRVLITGGAGFIGTHLCKRLLSEGCDIICLDNFFTGSKNNVVDFLSNPNFELKRHDIVQEYFAEVDQIYHLACPASPIHYQYNPIKTVKTSALGTINMLGLAKRVKSRILLASTSEIYGDPQVHPQPETYWGNVNTLGPRSCYDEGKRIAETLMMNYHTMNQVDIRIARIFNTYGPYMHPNDGRVVSNFIIQALKNEDITVYGEGNQTRSFCYCEDLVDGLIRLMSKESYHEPVNLGNPCEMTIRELAEKIISLTGAKSKLIYKELPKDDPVRRKPNIERAKKVLGWEPKVSLEKGLQNTIQYFDVLLKNT